MAENNNKPTTAGMIQVLDIVNKREALRKLSDMLPQMDWGDEGLKTTLFKLLPVFFSFFYINHEMRSFAIYFIQMFLLKHGDEIGTSYARLLVKWRDFISKGRKTTNSHTLTSISEDNKESDWNPFHGKLGYDDLEFFINVCKYVKYRKLHKYMYFFSNLEYLEFLSLKFGKDEIQRLEEKVGIRPITVSARGKILTMMTKLGRRVAELRKWAKGDYFWRTENMKEETELIVRTLDEIDRIGRTPIRKRDTTICAEEEEITILLEASVKKISIAVLKSRNAALNSELQRLISRFSRTYYFRYAQREIMRQMSLQIGKASFSNVGRYYERNGTSDGAPGSSANTSSSSPKEGKTISQEEFQSSFDRMVDYLIRLMV